METSNQNAAQNANQNEILQGNQIPSVGKRALVGVARRLRLLWFRARYSKAIFGAGCDIRRRFELRQAPNASVFFGDGCVLDNDLTVEVGGKLQVGARTIFGHHCTLAALESLVIGEDCLLAEMVSIRDHDHCFDRLEIPIREQGAVSSPVVIGKNVWLGAKVTVLKGVTIGDNAIVGAGAVVTKNIPENAICAGVPARVIRLRTPSP